MQIDLEGLTVERVVVHHIFKRDPERRAAPPGLGSSLITLPPDAVDSFQRRITEALGHRSHGQEMNIADSSAGTFFQRSAFALNASEQDFISHSQDMARKLASVQESKDLAASKLIIVSGRAGRASMPYFAIIKAELQDGFASTTDNAINHIRDLFLTPSQRLYKIGFIHNIVAAPPAGGLYDARNYVAFLFDHLLTMNETRNAAHYFYAEFLGMEILESDKKRTQEFFELTRTFINSAEIPQENKVELLEALRTELRNNRATLRTEDFANDHLDENVRRSYLSFMASKEFQANAFTKDTEYIHSRLRKRQKMSFHGGVEITAPPDKLHQFVKIESSHAERTVVVIHAAIASQE